LLCIEPELFLDCDEVLLEWELGCGLGDLLVDMMEAGYECRAVEHSPQMVAASRDTLKKHHLGTEATVIQGSAQSLPFSAETFDSVVSTFGKSATRLVIHGYNPRTWSLASSRTAANFGWSALITDDRR